MGNPARKGHHHYHHGAAGAGATSASAPATNNYYAHHHQHGDDKHNHPLGSSAHAGCPCCSPAPYAGLAGGSSAGSSSSSSSGSSHSRQLGLGPIHSHHRVPPVAPVPASSLTMSMQRAAAATTMAGEVSAAAATAASNAVRAAVMATAVSSTPVVNERAPTHAVTTSMPVPVPGVSAPRAPLRRTGSIMSTSSVTSSVSAATTTTSSPSTAGTAPSSSGIGSTPVRGRLARMAAVTLPSPPRPVPTGNAAISAGATPAEIAASLASSIASSVAASIASSVASSVASSSSHPATSTASGSTARRRGNVMRMASFRLPSTQVDDILAGNHVESNDDDDDDDPDIEEIRARTQRRAERLVAAHGASGGINVHVHVHTPAPARVAAPEPPAPVPVPNATTRRLAPTQAHNASWSSDSSSDSDSDNDGAQPTSFDTQYLAALRARQSQLIAAGLATSPAAARAAAAASSSAPRPVPPVQLQVQRAFNTPPPSFPFASAAIPRAPRLGSMYSTSLATPRAIAAASAAITAASFPDRQRRESLGLSQTSAAATAAASELAALADLLGQTPASLRAHLAARHADLHRGEPTVHPPADADLVAMLRDLMSLAPAPPRVPAPTVAMASPARVTSGQLL
ncbi:hypothetical protein GGF31_002581 [Allomyces arbusculus]|nr:hypothetical protein GGF31_002581 [Allomyces arbusculus]